MGESRNDGSGEGRQRVIKDSLKTLRDRMVHGLGGMMPERGLSYDQLVDLVYPALPDDLRAEVDVAAAGDLTRITTIRRMLGSIEHQRAPTAFSVQLTEEDAVRCRVGPIELFADTADGAVTPGLRSGEYEPHLTAIFGRYCLPGMTVVDVGANLGYYSLLAAHHVGPEGKVIALEPSSENCRLLLTSVRLAGVRNVEVLPVAADSRSGWAYYATHVGSNGGLVDDGDLLSRPGVVVPTFPLDDLVEGPVSFLKMDVEGAEGRVVKGARRIIEKDRPIVTTELKEEMLRRVSGVTVAEYLGYFEGLGYRPALLDKGSGAEKPYPTVSALLEEWGDSDELRDVLLLPSAS
jgi:FkbM family methyltransferase